MSERKTAFVSINLTEDARHALRQAVLDLTSPTGRRLSMSDVLVQALAVAARHQDELVAALSAKDPGRATQA